MTAVCPAGHTSTSDDYCDVCGMPIEASPSTAEAGTPPPPTEAPAQAPAQTSRPAQNCPNCGTPNVADALFCEACGYDFTTGTMPRPVESPDDQRATSSRRRQIDNPLLRKHQRQDRSTGWPKSGSTRAGTRHRRARTLAIGRSPGNRAAAGHLGAGRAHVEEPQHPSRDRLRPRLRR